MVWGRWGKPEHPPLGPHTQSSGQLGERRIYTYALKHVRHVAEALDETAHHSLAFHLPLFIALSFFHTSLSLTQLLPASHMPCPCALRQTPVFKQVWTGSKGSPNSPYSRWRARTVCHSALYVCHRRSVERMRIRDEYHPSSLLPSKLPSSPTTLVLALSDTKRGMCVFCVKATK